MTTKLAELKSAIKAFQAIQVQYRQFGAEDSEPDAVFQVLLVKAVKLKKTQVPLDANGWELYTCSMDCEAAAVALSQAAQKCLDVLRSCMMNELWDIRAYLSDFCWRVEW